MENLKKNNKRKRHSSTQKSPDNDAGKKKLNRTRSLQSLSSSPSSKLVDQLFQTWKNAIDSTNHDVATQKEQLFSASKTSISKLAALNLKKTSLNFQLSKLRKEKLSYCHVQMQNDRKNKFDEVMLNGAWEIIHFIYENMKCMLEKEAPFVHHLNEASEIRSAITQNLQAKDDKLVATPDEPKYLEIETSKEKGELEELANTSRMHKEEIEKFQDPDQVISLDDLEQNLQSSKEYINKLIEEEIGSESDLQKKDDLNLKHGCEYSRDLEELDKECEDLENELKNYDVVEGMLESIHTKMEEIISGNHCPDDSVQVGYAEEILLVKHKIKDLELKINLEIQRMKTAKCLPALESDLTEVKKKIDLNSMQTTELKNLDDSLVEVNNELKLLQKEQTTDEIKSRNEELEDLNHQEEVLAQENIENLRELNEYSNCKEEEQLISDLKIDFANKTKSHDEIMENYKKIKEVNSEHFEQNPTLLEQKDYKDFEEMKKKAQTTLVSAQRRASNSEKKNELKLKELEKKAEKYRAFMKEIKEEMNSEEKTFTHLENKIKDAEEQLEKKKEAFQKKETLPKKEALQEKEPLQKKEALQKKESIQKKEVFQNKVLPIKTNDEPVKVDMESLSWVKSLSRSLQKNIALSSSENDKASDEKPSHSQNVDQETFTSKNKSTEDEFEFSETQIDTEKSSQVIFQELLSQYGSQKSQQSAPSPFKSQNKPEKISVEPKSERKESQKQPENKFFKSPSRSLTTKTHKRSKSLPPKKF